MSLLSAMGAILFLVYPFELYVGLSFMLPSLGWTQALSTIIHISQGCEHWISRSPDLSKVLSAKAISSAWVISLGPCFEFLLALLYQQVPDAFKNIYISIFYSLFLVILNGKFVKGMQFAKHPPPHFSYTFSYPRSFISNIYFTS